MRRLNNTPTDLPIHERPPLTGLELAHGMRYCSMCGDKIRSPFCYDCDREERQRQIDQDRHERACLNRMAPLQRE